MTELIEVAKDYKGKNVLAPTSVASRAGELPALRASLVPPDEVLRDLGR